MNADRDSSEQPHVHEWVQRQSVTTRGYVLPAYEACECGSARPADAGTPPSAPEPSQAATEAHSDDERLERYVDALGKGLGCCDGTECDECLGGAQAVMAVADAEQAELRASLAMVGHAPSDRARAEAAEAKVARVRALLEQWDGATEANEDAYPVHARVMQVNIAELTAALDVDA